MSKGWKKLKPRKPFTPEERRSIRLEREANHILSRHPTPSRKQTKKVRPNKRKKNRPSWKPDRLTREYRAIIGPSPSVPHFVPNPHLTIDQINDLLLIYRWDPRP